MEHILSPIKINYIERCIHVSQFYTVTNTLVVQNEVCYLGGNLFADLESHKSFKGKERY